MCMAPQFDVSSNAYTWLTQSLFIARGGTATVSSRPGERTSAGTPMR